MDCGKDTDASNERYMLKDALWCSIDPLVIGILCLECAEDRLGRPLYKSDFSAPMNQKSTHACLALMERLKRPEREHLINPVFPT